MKIQYLKSLAVYLSIALICSRCHLSAEPTGSWYSNPENVEEFLKILQETRAYDLNEAQILIGNSIYYLTIDEENQLVFNECNLGSGRIEDGTATFGHNEKLCSRNLTCSNHVEPEYVPEPPVENPCPSFDLDALTECNINYSNSFEEQNFTFRTSIPKFDICNSKYPYVIFLHSSSGKVGIEVRLRENGETVCIKEVEGSYITFARTYEKFDFLKTHPYCVFSISNTKQDSQASKTGNLLFAVNLTTGSLDLIFKNYVRNPKPVVHSHYLYYVGSDQNIYQIDLNDAKLESTLAWENDTDFDIIDFDLRDHHSFIKLQGCSNHIYKFFSDSFKGELPTEAGVTDFEYFQFPYDKTFQEFGTMALVEIGDGQHPPKQYIRRWFTDATNVFSQSYTISDVSFDEFGDEFVHPYSLSIQNTIEGTTIPINVWPARDSSAESPKPLIVFLNAGCETIQDNQFSFFNQYSANQGFWNACPKRRSTSTFGKNYFEDIVAIAEHFKKNPSVDSNSIFLLGYGFGGYSTLSMATNSNYSNYFNGYVASSGISNVGKFIYEKCKKLNPWAMSEDGFYMDWDGSKKEYSPHQLECFAYWNKKAGTNNMRENYDANAKNIEISPIHHVNNINKPIFLLHGTNSTYSNPNQSEDFFLESLKANKQVYGVLIEGDGGDRHFDFYSILMPFEIIKKLAKKDQLDAFSSNKMLRTNNAKDFIKRKLN